MIEVKLEGDARPSKAMLFASMLGKQGGPVLLASQRSSQLFMTTSDML